MLSGTVHVWVMLFNLLVSGVAVLFLYYGRARIPPVVALVCAATSSLILLDMEPKYASSPYRTLDWHELSYPGSTGGVIALMGVAALALSIAVCVEITHDPEA